MSLKRIPFIVPFLSAVYVAAVCALALLSVCIYLNMGSPMAYSVLPSYKSTAVFNHSLPSETPDPSEAVSASGKIKPDLPPDAPDYMRLYPQMYGSGLQPGHEAARDMTLYLTFDDGPSKNTNTVLDILDRYGIKATFFVVPNESQSCTDRLREIHERGHTIGVHSKTHDYQVIYKDVEAYLADFSSAYEIIYQATGAYPTLFRFPGGSINSYNSETRDLIIQEMNRRGFIYFDWNVSAQDAQNRVTSEKIYQNVLSTLGKKKSGVVLMHDSGTRKTTVEALPRIIETLRAKGFQFDRLSNRVHPVKF